MSVTGDDGNCCEDHHQHLHGEGQDEVSRPGQRRQEEEEEDPRGVDEGQGSVECGGVGAGSGEKQAGDCGQVPEPARCQPRPGGVGDAPDAESEGGGGSQN
jgi:hypothetical protein